MVNAGVSMKSLMVMKIRLVSLNNRYMDIPVMLTPPPVILTPYNWI